MYRWQNGTRCRDGVKVLWCRSCLVWLVFEDFIPTCACLRLANFFVTLWIYSLDLLTYMILTVWYILLTKLQHYVYDSLID